MFDIKWPDVRLKIAQLKLSYSLSNQFFILERTLSARIYSVYIYIYVCTYCISVCTVHTVEPWIPNSIYVYMYVYKHVCKVLQTGVVLLVWRQCRQHWCWWRGELHSTVLVLQSPAVTVCWLRIAHGLSRQTSYLTTAPCLSRCCDLLLMWWV